MNESPAVLPSAVLPSAVLPDPLPTMQDLDDLQLELDQVDLRLSQIDKERPDQRTSELNRS